MIIVIEGTDGCGKETQTKLLYEYLKSTRKNVKMQSFPNYDDESSFFVKKYLNGDFGDLNNLTPFQASVLFSVDRFITMKKYQNFLNDGGILLLDRYVSSNFIYQSSKIDNIKEREILIKNLEEFEYENLKIPKPDLTIFLDISPEISKKLLQNRKNKKSGTEKDIHENDENYLKKCYQIGKEIAKLKNWKIVKCFKDDNILSINEIHLKIKNIIDNILGENYENV